MNAERPRGERPLRPLSDALGRALRGLRVADNSSTSVFTRWRDVVGDVVADNATPVRLEKKRLIVEVTDPAWATQLRFLESTLLATLRDALGDEIDAFDVRVRRPR
jgi:predicted nucleic acid-binding Zn ribbon protein